MAAPGVEMAVGVVHEPPFGPVLMLAAGGVLTDILDDRAWRILPLTDLDAEAMVGSLKSSALLRGFRGGPVADTAALLDVLHRVASARRRRAGGRRARPESGHRLDRGRGRGRRQDPPRATAS